MRVLAFGNEHGLPRLLRLLPRDAVTAVARAANRPGAAPSLERLAAEHGVPLLVHPLAGDPELPAFVARVTDLRPDLILVDSYSQRLTPELLAAAPHGGVNVHGALLPRHRGANPTQWALIDDDRETGVTVHRMTAGFDEGDVLAQSTVPIHFEDTWVDVNRRIGEATDALLAHQLPRILAGDLAGTPQDESRATYRPRRTAEDGRIDWSASCLAIYNLVRALVAPHPGAFYERAGERVVLDRLVPIGQIAAMKFGPDGGQQSPLGRPRADGDDIVAGEERLTGIDWDRRIAVVREPSPALRDFAAAELGLAVAGA